MSAKGFRPIRKINKVIAPDREQSPVRARRSGRAAHNRISCRYISADR